MMDRTSISNFLKAGIIAIVVLIAIGTAVVVTPSFAGPAVEKAGMKDDTLRVVPQMTQNLELNEVIFEGQIAKFRVVDEGELSWCDAFIFMNTPDTPAIESFTLTTNDPKINNVLLMAWMGRSKIIAKALPIPKPPGRKWSGYDTLFYEITEITLDQP